MEKNGLLVNVDSGVSFLAEGRRLLYTQGTEAEGLKMYQKGCKMLISLFDEALATNDAELMFLSEFYYTSCELSASQGSEPVAMKSAQSAVRKFEEGLAALQTVIKPEWYQALHIALSTEPSFRYKGMPKDAFHVACMSDIARVRNGLSRMGLSDEDKAIARKRIAVMTGAQDAYIEMQRQSVPAV